MKLVLVAYRLDVAAGLERALARLATALDEQPDHEIEILYLRKTPAAAIRVLLPQHVALKSARGVKVVRLVGRLLGARHRTVVCGLWAAAIATPLWVAIRPIGRFLRRLPPVLWEHTLVPGRIEHDRKLTLASRFLWWVYRQYDTVVVVSEASRKYLSERMDLVAPSWRKSASIVVIENIEPIPPRGSFRAESFAPTSGPVRLFAAHRLTRVKNTALVIAALRFLPPRFHLDIAGSGPELGALELQVEELGLSGRVSFLGFRDDVPELLRQCHIVVHPSVAETYALIAFEAASLGKPLVCLKAGALADFVPDLIPGQALELEADATSFASAIEYAYRRYFPDDPAGQSQVAADFSKASSARAVQFGEERIVPMWLNALATVGS